jgi:hypothetical protein
MLVNKGTKNDKELYQDCWLSKWKCNLVDKKQWVDNSFIEFLFLAKSNVTINSIITISGIHASKAKQKLEVTNEITSM